MSFALLYSTRYVSIVAWHISFARVGTLHNPMHLHLLSSAVLLLVTACRMLYCCTLSSAACDICLSSMSRIGIVILDLYWDCRAGPNESWRRRAEAELGVVAAASSFSLLAPTTWNFKVEHGLGRLGTDFGTWKFWTPTLLTNGIRYLPVSQRGRTLSATACMRIWLSMVRPESSSVGSA